MSKKTPTKKNGVVYAIDAPVRTIVVDYPDRKMKIAHDFKKVDDRDIIQYYLNAPSLKARAKGEAKLLGTPDAPAAELHDLTCQAARQLDLEGNVTREFTQEEIRELWPSMKIDGMMAYLGGYYSVELESETGNQDDLLFDRAMRLVAKVKTHPTGRKSESSFKVYVNRPDALSLNRFINQSSTTSVVDERRDEIIQDFIGEENLEAMTGDEDEGERMAFFKETQHVRQFIDVYNKNFDGFEDVTFNGEPYQPKDSTPATAATDPVLKIAVSFAMRNFF